MIDSNLIISVITLNINSLSTQIKRHRLSDRIRKQDTAICSLQETHRNELKEWKKIHRANIVSHNVVFRAQNVSQKKSFHNDKAVN